jgi:hypothetical protein
MQGQQNAPQVNVALGEAAKKNSMRYNNLFKEGENL